jgi:hypothetical protein
MRTILSLVPGVGHFVHGRRGRGLALGAAWLAFLAVALLAADRVPAAFARPDLAQVQAGERPPDFDAKLAVFFLFGMLVALPVDCAGRGRWWAGRATGKASGSWSTDGSCATGWPSPG